MESEKAMRVPVIYLTKHVVCKSIVATLLALTVGMAHGMQLHAMQPQSKPQMLTENKGVKKYSDNEFQAVALKKVLSVDLENVTLEQGLNTIARKAGLKLVYSSNIIPAHKRVSLQKRTATLENVLWALLADTGLRFGVSSNNHLVIMKWAKEDKKPVPQVQAETVSGTVTDAQSGETLPGVNILVKGTSTGASTDSEGNYELEVESLQDTLVVSFVGYKTQQVPINGRSEINVALQTQAISGEEMVVVGYGEQKRANLTGSVSTVRSQELEGRATSNLDQMLQGVAPGLNLQYTSGFGGELDNRLDINIRGTGTIGEGSNSEPLILIDGIEGDLNSINPKDIESISVLKDAAASAVYGSRAAFGVVLITTKEGKAGETQINYSNNFRFTTPMKLPTMMDSYTFALYFNEAAINNGEGAIYSDEQIDRIIRYQNGELAEGTVPESSGDRWAGGFDGNANTDWYDVHYKDFAFAQDHNLSVSGGTEAITYYVSGNFVDQQGLATYMDDKLKRYNLTGKINGQISKNMKFNLTNRYISEDYNRSRRLSGNFYDVVSRRSPTTPVKTPNGYYIRQSQVAQALRSGRRDDQTVNYYIQGKLIYSPLKNWEIHAEGNYRIRNQNNHSHRLPVYFHRPNGEPYINGSKLSRVNESRRKNKFYNINIYSNYQFNPSDVHHFKFMAGFNSDLEKIRSLSASRDGLITRALPTINTATTNSQAKSGGYGHWATAGFFGRFNYDYKSRYLLEINARYDGSSRFLKDQRWDLFPSVSVGWDMAEEKFWVLSDLINQFKIRGSYGELGNQNTSDWYPFYPTMPISVNSGSWLVDGQRTTVASSPGLISSRLSWERIKNWNAGLDLSMLDNRLKLSFDLFERKTTDMIGPAPQLPAVLGTSVPSINNADMKSTGYEVALRWRDQIGEFNYNIKAVFSDDKQEILRYPNPSRDIYNWYAGKMMGEIWGYETVGMAHTKKEMDEHLEQTGQSILGSNWGAGDIMYRDINNDGVLDNGSSVLGNTGDLRVIGNSHPRYRYGLNIGGSYKNLDFQIFLQGVGKRDFMPYDNSANFWGTVNGMWRSVGFEEHMDYFRDENSYMVQAGHADQNINAYFPKIYIDNDKNKYAQTRYLQDASYLRLKNLQLGYHIPVALLPTRIEVSDIRVFVSGENLLTLTNLIRTYDPEEIGLNGWSDGKTYPLAKVYSFGVEINF